MEDDRSLIELRSLKSSINLMSNVMRRSQPYDVSKYEADLQNIKYVSK